MKLTEQQTDILDRYLLEVIEANKTTNLTRIDSLENGRLLHIEDSLAGLQEFQDAPDGLYADLGTGGGFPGVPLSVVTSKPVLLVDSVQKKMCILDAIVQDLNLSDMVTTYAGRAEELAKERPAEFQILTARALTALPSLLELAAPLLKKGGRLICYKSTNLDQERADAVALEDMLGMKELSYRQTCLSDGKTERAIIVYEKVHEPQVKLPRRPGMAQKRPYKG